MELELATPFQVMTGAVHGVEAIPITIEATLHADDEKPRILGLVDAGVRESFHRVLGAFAAQDLPYPRGCPTLNFTPARHRKSGSGFDLPMALALAGAAGTVPRAQVQQLAAYGELELTGRVQPVPGALAIAIAVRARGVTRMLVAPADAPRVALVPGLAALPVRDLAEALAHLTGKCPIAPSAPDPGLARADTPTADLADVRGHETPKRALLVAAAGGHNLLLVGPPGSGKTALAQRIGGLLPRLDRGEALEILRIHTSQSQLRPAPLGRPLRAPHHTSSTASLLGGGSEPRPGEVTLAHHGVLFLDELAEFRREALEALRQPLEDGRVTIGRARAVVTMPAEFLLLAAMNPCPCGYLGHPTRPCVCTPPQRQRYLDRISGPLLDRLDLQVEVPALPPTTLRAPPDPQWSTAVLAERVAGAISRQRRRRRRNARLADRELELAVRPGETVLRLLDELLHQRRWSARTRVRLLRIARTLADLDDRDEVQAEDLLEAAELRSYAGRM